MIARKVWVRLFDPRRRAIKDARQWYLANAIDFNTIFRSKDALLQEAIEWDNEFTLKAAEILEELDVKLGGGGNCALLYYLVRRFKPNVVVETGVAAGFSSQTILRGLYLNGRGRLYSSDFPYFRLENPEKYIGILVEENFRAEWRLFIEGDSRNLTFIKQELGDQKIELFHYDSDKSYIGRQSTWHYVESMLASDAVVVFDDIIDNSHFKDLIISRPDLHFGIIAYRNKLVGIFSKDRNQISFFLNSN